MPKQVRLRRGTTAQHATFAGALGEVTFYTSNKTVVAHDGATLGGFPVALEAALTATEVKTGNLVWVDAVNGDDATGLRGRLQKPFKTLTAAKTAAQSGDTITVLPGVYNEKNLLKNGVNWHFLLGAKVIYTGSASGGIFDDGTGGTNGAVVCKITGQGEFVNSGSDTLSWVFIIGYSGTDIHFEALSVTSEFNNAIRVIGGTTRISVRTVRSNSARAVELYGGVTFLRADEIVSTGGIGLDLGGGKNTVHVDSISSSAGAAVHASGGTSHLTARELQSTAGYGLHAEFTEDPVILTVNGTRIISTLATTAGKAVYVNGTNDLTLKDCVLVANVTGTPAPASIDAPAAVDVRIYGCCMANVAKGANVNFVTGATRFEVDADVR